MFLWILLFIIGAVYCIIYWANEDRKEAQRVAEEAERERQRLLKEAAEEKARQERLLRKQTIEKARLERSRNAALQKNTTSKMLTCANCSRKVSSNVRACPSCGMDMTFDITKAGHFTKFVMTNTETLLNIIKGSYDALKQMVRRDGITTCPRLGYNGCIELAELLILIRYIFTTNETEEGRKTASFLTAAAIKAFDNSFSPSQWTETTDNVVEKLGVITTSDWNEAYCYIKTYYFDEINEMEFARAYWVG